MIGSTTSLFQIMMTVLAFRWSTALCLRSRRFGITTLPGTGRQRGGRRPQQQLALFSSRLNSTATFSAQPDAATNTNKEASRSRTILTKSNNMSNSKLSKNTGGLRRLPVAKNPKEIMNRALKVARGIPVDSSIANARTRARKHGAESINAVTQALCIPLRDVVKGYQTELRRLHPFEKVVADLTIQARQDKDGLTLEEVLHEINEVRKEILQAGKDWTAKAKTAETAREAGDAREQGMEALAELFDRLATPALEQIVELQRSLRTAPIVQLDTPAVVLVGAPNVGKSSIVRAISSASPEINNYPFTTRAMTLGHVEVFWSAPPSEKVSTSDESEGDETSSSSTKTASAPQVVNAHIPQDTLKYRFRRHRSLSYLESSPSSTASYAFSQLCQVMDSPGLLVRDEEENRNEMERLTLASLQHLPTAVMFVMDLSGNAGDRCSSLADQLTLRRQIRARFPRRPWIDVVSKVDLGIDEASMTELEEILEGAPCIRLSIHESIGLDDLRSHVLRMLGEVQLVLDAMAAIDERSARPE